MLSYVFTGQDVAMLSVVLNSEINEEAFELTKTISENYKEISILVKWKYTEIENKIYTIRGLQVMLDKDIALFYEVKPIRLREQMERNSKRFPADFVFQLNDGEVDFMVSQNAIPSIQSPVGYLPLIYLSNKEWPLFQQY